MQQRLPTLIEIRRGSLAGRLLVWLTCLFVLPLPMPTLHRHDEMDSPYTLEVHLNQRHGDTVAEALPIDQPHWHFVMPFGQDGDEHHDDESPRPPPQYVAGQLGGNAASVTALSSSLEQAGVQFVWSSGLSNQIDVIRSAASNPSTPLIKAAVQRQRSAHACVMRC